jgi:hypothetical protein
VNLARITAVRLEMLMHDSIESFGPGFADNGNFVLTEFSGQWVPASDQNKAPAGLVFGRAEATFSQDEFPVTKAVDNNRNETDNGWSVSGGVGETQTAVFHLNDPLKLTEPVQLTFVLEQLFKERTHSIGCFRISVTDDADPVLDGVPQDIDRILSVVEAARTDEQKERLLEWFHSWSKERQKRVLAVGKSRRPRPKDPEIVERENELALVSEPVPRDPLLARLERAARLSEEQLKDRRKTMVQDLAWALINSPSFLFNR